MSVVKLSKPLGRPRLWRAITVVLLSLTVAWGSSPASAKDKPASKTTLTLFTAVTATTPQIPFWAAVHQGWPEGYDLKVDYWKTLDDLRGLTLADRGDLWIGNLEGFARAADRGAPVCLAAVTGWKKFYFVAAPSGSSEPLPTNLEELAADLKQAGRPLAAAPQNSPAIGIVEDMARRGGPAFTLETLSSTQLMLELERGSIRYGLLPEPLVSALLIKNPRLTVVASLEEEYARRFGGPAGLPLVGLAVNRRLARERPDLVEELVRAMKAQAEVLRGQPASVIADFLPPEVVETVGRDVLKNSLTRDLLLVKSAEEAEADIARFLRLVAPDLYEGRPPDWSPSADFIFRARPAAGQ